MPIARRRIVELAVEVLIVFAVVVGPVILYAEIGPLAWMPSARWWMLATMTGILLWYVLRLYRHQWRRRFFWVHMTWLTAIHVAAWSILLADVSEWGLLWFVPPTVAEAVLVVFVLQKLGYEPRLSSMDSSGAA